MPKTKKLVSASGSDSDSGPEDVSSPQIFNSQNDVFGVGGQIEIVENFVCLRFLFVLFLQRNPAPKKAKKDGDTTKTDDKGNAYWELDRNRRVSLSEFKGKQYLNIREYYQDKTSGEESLNSRMLTSCS